MKIISPSPLMGEGGGEGESTGLPPHLNPLPSWGEEVFLVIFKLIVWTSPPTEGRGDFLGLRLFYYGLPSKCSAGTEDPESPGIKKSRRRKRFEKEEGCR